MSLILLLTACESGGIVLKETGEDVPTDTAGDTDTDTDSDSDGDSDTDTDTDTDTGFEVPDIIVDCNGSGDHTTIQGGIDDAISGQRVGVKPCTYHERLHYYGKAIDVYGIEGSAVTILDADYEGTAVNIESGETLGTRFAGFTIEDGYDEYGGAAFEFGVAVAELEDIVITQSEGNSIIESLGGFIDAKDVTIEDSTAYSQAIWADSGGFTAEGLDVDCGGAEQGIWHHIALNLDHSRIVCDSGIGVYNYHGTSIIQRSYIYGGDVGLYSKDEEGTPENPDSPNEENYVYASAIGGGNVGADMLYQYVIFENSVLWGGESALRMTLCNASSYAMNSAFLNSACAITGDQPFQASYSAFYDNGQDGCGVTVTPTITGDPRFTNFPDDLTLRSDSPLIDAGNPNGAYNDPDGSRNDIGRYGGPYGD